MALAAFDLDKHHIALAEVGSDGPGYGFVTAGSYDKGFRREKESEFNGVRYGGGDSLVNKPGVSSWTMDDFTGGAFQYVWGKDQAMFARSKNALPSQFDRSLRSVPGLQKWLDGTNVVTAEDPLVTAVYNGYLYTAFEASFIRWNLTTAAPGTVALGGGGTYYKACFLADRGHILRSIDDVISAFDLDVFSGYSWSVSPPDPAVGNVTGMSGDGDRLIVAYDDVLWTATLPDDRTAAPDNGAGVSGDGDFTRIGRLPGRWAASCWASGLLYILLAGYDTPTRLVAFDGTQILPICDFPYNFVGQSLCAYGGRVYVGGSGADVQTGAGRYAELYEVTGASLRLLKTFAPEVLGAGEVYGTTIPAMAVHEGLLFFGIKGLGLVAYDLTTDAFYGASNFAPADTSADFRHLLSGRESLFSWVYPINGSPGASGWYRPATSQETVETYTTELETSDFAMAFDRTKKWRQLRVLTRFLTLTLTCSYSTDGGTSWTALSAPTLESSGRFQLNTFDLSDVPETRAIRFKFGLPNGTSVSAFRELVAFTASFRMMDSDAVGTGEREKLAWTFVIYGGDRVAAADQSDIIQDVAAIRAQLWDWARGRDHLVFRDVDGQAYTVEVDTLREQQPNVLPVLDQETLQPGDQREAFYQVTLVEV